MGSDPSDADLAVALAVGRQDALAALYDRYGRLAYSVALRVLGDPGRAEDAVQDSFLKLWNNSARFDASRGSLRSWLMITVRNRSIDYLRGRAGHEREERELMPSYEAVGSSSDPWREVSQSLERSAVREALTSLPTEQRQAVELAYFGGYSCREIAGMTRVPLSTVKGRMRLALEKLGSYLQGRGADRCLITRRWRTRSRRGCSALRNPRRRTSSPCTSMGAPAAERWRFGFAGSWMRFPSTLRRLSRRPDFASGSWTRPQRLHGPPRRRSASGPHGSPDPGVDGRLASASPAGFRCTPPRPSCWWGLRREF